jgi:hypothetical protein
MRKRGGKEGEEMKVKPITNIPIHKYTNTQIYHTQIYQYTNTQITNTPIYQLTVYG